MDYNFSEIEKKWQKRWETEEKFKAVDLDYSRPKYYILYEFPNISGNIHVGHLKGTIPADVLARYKRFKGYNVLFPIGGDSFGLPAEEAAIKRGINPRKFVEDGSKTILNGFKSLGLSFDYSRYFNTSDPEYYKWTQWIFKQLFDHGKAYKEKGTVNFCPHCQTVLSNEDSQGGKCDRCGSDVIQKNRDVWFLKMREYSDKLLGNVDRINMVESLKEAQRNWIGKSEGVELKLDVVNKQGKKIDELKIFTTCIETVYGITFVALAPENEMLDKLKPYITNFADIEKYREQTALKSELDRQSNVKDKTGCKVEGIYVINPVNNKKVSVFAADFVLNSYATGAVMAVPTHDQRDYEFADKFKIEKIQVIEGDVSKQAVEKQEYLKKNSKMLNSGEFSGMPVKEAKKAITDYVVKKGYGTKTINYRMTDWAFNRQRYWGEPIPVVFCDHCGTVVLDEKDLPLTLPETNDYLPNKNGDSPLSKIDSFVNCKCPKCGRPATRETDVMPNWAGSSWYWLRYTDPHNDKALADMEKLKYWGSVDCYTGGTEHITRHVLYSFFWQNFLYEIGAVPTRDPFIRKMGSGLVLDDEGKKMSKSSKNGVSPADIIAKYGTDATRLHTHFLAAYEDSTLWTLNGIEGITNFLDKVWALPKIIKGEKVSRENEVALNALIKKVGEDYEALKLNTAIAAFMSFMKQIKQTGFITKDELKAFLVLLNPLAPHITSEVYEIVFGGSILDEKWPEFDPNKLVLSTVNLPVQVNGKMKGTIAVDRNASQAEVIKAINASADFNINTTAAKKIIFVPGRIINIIL